MSANWTLTPDIAPYVEAMAEVPAIDFAYTMQVCGHRQRYGYAWLIGTQYEDEMDERNVNLACSESVGEGLPFPTVRAAMDACERYYNRRVATVAAGEA